MDGGKVRYLSLFSGIECLSVAVEGLGWEPVAFSEIEKAPCRLLAEKYPDVPNLGDIRNIRYDRERDELTNGTTSIPLRGKGIDVVAGGFPCQSVSVAGKRAGMRAGSGTRSSLGHELLRLVGEIRPTFFLVENVPGLLSSNRGADFAEFLREMAELGFTAAWRVLDAQYTRTHRFPRGVAQRRRRVWIVGHSGADGRIPAEILLEPTSTVGDRPPRRKQAQAAAASAGRRPGGDDRVVGRPEPAGEGREVGGPPPATTHRGADVFPTVDAGMSAFVSNQADAAGQYVLAPATDPHKPDGRPVVALSTANTHSNGSNVNEGGAAYTLDGSASNAVAVQSECLTPGHPLTHRVFGVDGAYPTIQANEGGGQNQQAVLAPVRPDPAPLEGNAPSACILQMRGGVEVDSNGHKAGKGPLVKHEVAPCIAAAQDTTLFAPSVAALGFKGGQSSRAGLGAEAEVSPTLSAKPSALDPTVAIDGNKLCKSERAGGSGLGVNGDGAMYTLTGSDAHAHAVALPRMIVRRLTPLECERLQGLPDNYTACMGADTPRYKACGNGWAVNCAEWVVRRIDRFLRKGEIQ